MTRTAGVPWGIAALAVWVSVSAAERPTLTGVRPFAGDDDLAIYGKPVADEVAAALTKAGLKAEVLIGDQTRGDVIVELKVVRQKKLVRLEAVVRPAAGGEVVAQGAAKAVRVEQLGRAAARLAHTLAPKIAALKLAPPAPAPAPPTPGPASAPGTVPPPPPSAPAASAAPDPRPAIAICAPDGTVAGQPLKTLGIAPLRQVPERAGFRVVEAPRAGMLPANTAGQLARAQGARAILMVYVVGTDFIKKGVLFGRGRIQVMLVGDDGVVRFNRVVNTDTVVGSRDDGEGALVGFMLRQAMDIVGRDLARVLPR